MALQAHSTAGKGKRKRSLADSGIRCNLSHLHAPRRWPKRHKGNRRQPHGGRRITRPKNPNAPRERLPVKYRSAVPPAALGCAARRAAAQLAHFASGRVSEASST